LKHYGSGWVNMANHGEDTNGSQFAILTTRAQWLDGKHIVFGKILEGMDVIEAIELVHTDTNDRPIEDITVVACGELPLEKPFSVAHE